MFGFTVSNFIWKLSVRVLERVSESVEKEGREGWKSEIRRDMIFKNPDWKRGC